jgi:hypothetical protein
MRIRMLILLACMANRIGECQTNYPPNTVPWNNHPTNWVYDCTFTGYGNLNPNATNLPCAWVDEPTNIIFLPFYVPFVPGTNLALTAVSTVFRQEISFLGRFTITNVVSDVTVSFTNACAGSNYTVFASTDLQNWNNIGSFTAADSASNWTMMGRMSSAEFYRIYGPPAPPPEKFAGVILADPRTFHTLSCFSGGLFLCRACFRNLKL